MIKKTDVQRLTDEISRLMAALEDVNFECQKLMLILIFSLNQLTES